MEMRFGVRLHVLEDLCHVVARREVRARTAQDHQTDFFGLAPDRIYMLLQVLEDVFRKGIEFLGPVQYQGRSTATIFPSD